MSRCTEAEPHGAGVWATLALIAISAVCGALTDLSFSLKGYMWQILNCALTAGFSLSLRGAMDKASAPRSFIAHADPGMKSAESRATHSTCFGGDMAVAPPGGALDEERQEPGRVQHGKPSVVCASPSRANTQDTLCIPSQVLSLCPLLLQVYYNNVLSLPLLCVVAAVNGEWSRVFTEPAIYHRGFQAAAVLSAFCGFLISFCSLWFLSTTTATTFSLVGSLNKVRSVLTVFRKLAALL